MSEWKKEFDKIIDIYNNSEEPLKKLLYSLKKDPLVLYGCGSVCHYVISACNDLNIKIVSLCDTYKSGLFDDTGLEILSPEQTRKKYPGSNIVICSYKFAEEISEKLIATGFSETQIYRLPANMPLLIHPSEFTRKYYSGYKWAHSFFTDNISKEIVINRIKMYINGTKLHKTSDVSEYFDNGILSLGTNEVFVDGGAYIGDTAEEFIKQTQAMNIGYRHIYSFEPDENARSKAISNLAKYSKVDVVGKGLWSCETRLNFYNDGGCASSSFVNGVRTISVPVTSLDSFFLDKSEEELPTFIKMDIEGSEKEALIGAKTVIRQKHPKLAICVYHKPEDIYELPKLIYGIDPSYQFFLRQCADGIYETVLYAI